MDSKDIKTSNETFSSPIVDFYNKKSVFITGGTGFVGMVLIQKLLSSCCGIKNVYVLIKPKYGKSVQDRTLDIKKSEVFQRLKENMPEALNKIIPIAGDLLDNNIGLSEIDTEILRKEVSIVFHVAANVNFSMSLHEAVVNNSQSTERVIKLGKRMEKLEAFIYVSTAFCNCYNNNDLIREKVMKTDVSLKALYHVIEEANNNSLCLNIMDGRTNTYTFSKAVAEDLIANEMKEVPTAIVRPSIVLSSLRDPIPGWLQGWNGVNRLLTGIVKGTIRCWYADLDAVIDIIPVDFVANLTIAAAWDTSTRRGKREVKVFNCCSGLQNPLIVRDFFWKTIFSFKKYAVGYSFPMPLIVVKSISLFSVLFFFLQTVPAFVYACICCVFGCQNKAMLLRDKLRLLVTYIGFYTRYQFLFSDLNVKELYLKMDEKDQTVFDFNVKNIDWDKYLENNVIGIKNIFFTKNR